VGLGGGARGIVVQADGPDVVWRKSSFSAEQSCVEVAFDDQSVLVRDSKDRHGPILRFTVQEWAAFLDFLKVGGFGSGELEL